MATSDDGSYILTKDAPGEKPRPAVLALFTKKPRRLQIPRGELISPRDTRHPANGGFRLKRDPSVTLHGSEDGADLSPLDSVRSELLEAIPHPSDRFAIFSEESKLDWGEKLRCGDQVYVKLPASRPGAPTWTPALVRYVGKVEKLQGRAFGVEITVSLEFVNTIHIY